MSRLQFQTQNSNVRARVIQDTCLMLEKVSANRSLLLEAEVKCYKQLQLHAHARARAHTHIQKRH